MRRDEQGEQPKPEQPRTACRMAPWEPPQRVDCVGKALPYKSSHPAEDRACAGGQGRERHDFRQGPGGPAAPILAKPCETRQWLLVRIAGLVACAMVGLPLWRGAAAAGRQISVRVMRFRPRRARALRRSCSGCSRERGNAGRWSLRLGVVALHDPAQRSGCPGHFLDYTLTGILLVLTAASLTGEILPLRSALAWVAAQTAGLRMDLQPSTSSPWVTVATHPRLRRIRALRALQLRHGPARSARPARSWRGPTPSCWPTRQLLADSSRAAERVRISRELHDVMGHHLAALSLEPGGGPRTRRRREVPSTCETAQALTKRLLREVRRVVGHLREEAPLDLAGALATLAAGTERPEVHLSVPEDLRIEDPERAHALLRCAQEALTNAMPPRRSEKRLDGAGPGRGGDRAPRPGRRPGRRRRRGRQRPRAACASGWRGSAGQLAVDSAPGRGFAVTARVPSPAWERPCRDPRLRGGRPDPGAPGDPHPPRPRPRHRGRGRGRRGRGRSAAHRRRAAGRRPPRPAHAATSTASASSGSCARPGALPPTLVLTTFDDDALFLEAVRAGAKGFLLKDVSLERLTEAIRTVAAGRHAASSRR